MWEVGTMANSSTKTPELAGVIGYFDEPGKLMEAAQSAREARFGSIDTFTPYPIHGMEAAQGLRRSFLPWVTFGAGLTGVVCGYLLQYWTSAVDWPLNVGGKPLNSGPAFIPVTFEATVLFAGLFTVGAMFLVNGLPNIKRRAFDPRLTRDRFALLIEAPSERQSAALEKRGYRKFSEGDAQEFLKKAGAQGVQAVYTEGWFD